MYLERGDYTAAISACNTALSLLNADSPEHDAIRHKHIVRKTRAYVLAARYDDAISTIETDAQAFEKEDLLFTWSKLYANANAHLPDPIRARDAIVLTMPRYKPAL